LIEAIATSLPVITSHVGGIPELIVNGKNGFLIPPTSKEKIEEAGIKFLSNKNSKKEWEKLIAKDLKKFFSLRKMVHKYLQIYLQDLKGD